MPNVRRDTGKEWGYTFRWYKHDEILRAGARCMTDLHFCPALAQWNDTEFLTTFGQCTVETNKRIKELEIYTNFKFTKAAERLDVMSWIYVMNIIKTMTHWVNDIIQRV